MSSLSKWNLAQIEELSCWRDITPKLQRKEYNTYRREVWNKILYKIDIESIISHVYLRTDQNKPIKIIDIGCGPSGILCELPSLNSNLFNNDKRFDYIGVDPLMSHYLKIVPALSSYPVTWINGTGEDLSSLVERPVQIIFSINALDHTQDIRQCLRSMEKCLIPGGVAVISLNCHARFITAYLFSRFGIEKLHPFQITQKMFIKLLNEYAPSMRIEKVICLD
jgi:2-polyprenyl-3-methyl-5-hydroxy-6-metoxy-1,4-benzoquinol methylase